VLPPLVSFNSVLDLKRAVRASGELSKLEDKIFDRLSEAGLPPLVSPTVLGLILGVSPKLITSLANHPRRKYPYYRRYKIPKRAGGVRTILAPRTYLKAVQRFILKRILESQPLPKYVMGFVRGRGIVQNARVHVGADYLLNVDVKDFFPSVRTEHVLKVFRRLGFPEEMSRVLSFLCTYEGCLPQGAPTSPYLANLAFGKIDEELVRISEKRSLKYSRYADDLTFSGSEPIEEGFVSKVDEILRSHGFNLNAKKIKLTRPGQAKYVTGLVVNKRVQPDRRARKTLRAMFHRASLHPRGFREKAASLAGWASYVYSYDKALGSKYLNIARKVASA
jgi:RNA-directed DNA polymerase